MEQPGKNKNGAVASAVFGDTRFKPGHSGNPNGRPKGSLNATTLAAQALLDGEARPRSLLGRRSSLPKVAILRPFAFVSIASVPPRKDRPVSFDLPKIESARDAANAISAVLTAVSTGDLTPAEASGVTRLLDA